MTRKILKIMLTIVLIVCTYTTSLCLEKNDNTFGNKDTKVNNISDIEVEVVDIDIRDEEINIGKKYSTSAIVTMNIKNNSAYDVELSNIDIYPYQGDKATKYFVSTSEENITGFIGNLRSKENTQIKMGIALHNNKEPIKLEMLNIEDITNEKVVESINIK
ncbi:MAG: hypothetical protein RRZ84_01040 [Romboutsia sp.]